MSRCRRTSLWGGVVALALLLSACVPGGIQRNSLPHLSKGMTPVQAAGYLRAQPACRVRYDDNPYAELEVYRLLSASYSAPYYLLYHQGELRYWGTPSEFKRRDERAIRRPAEMAAQELARGTLCKDGVTLLLHGGWSRHSRR